MEIKPPCLAQQREWKSCHLSNQLSNLKRDPVLFKEFDNRWKEQLAGGIIKKELPTTTSKEFYIQHKPLVKQSAETTELWVVYDASAKPTGVRPSLNEWLNVGPVLQNMLWNGLTRCCLKSVAITEDLKEGFLQIRINKDDQDAMRFSSIKDREILETVVLRLICLRFGPSPSPFVLEGIIKHYLERYQQD